MMENYMIMSIAESINQKTNIYCFTLRNCICIIKIGLDNTGQLLSFSIIVK